MEKLLPTVLLAVALLSVSGDAAEARQRRPPLPADVAVPTPRPDTETTTHDRVGRDRQEMPDDAAEIPVPQARPDEDRDAPHAPAGNAARIRESVGRHNARRTEAGGPDAACLRRLRDLGVEFEVERPIAEGDGCSVPDPVSVSTLGSGIALEPAGLMNCAMAEAAARFSQTVVAPAARSAYGAGLKAISNASTYACRPRNGTTKLSEHAFGNALDIARFVLADETAIDVTATDDAKARDFLDRIRKAACGPFRTVLGPGSDADHATHFHFDLAKRRNGSTFCQ
jgi:hypothetical protein